MAKGLILSSALLIAWGVLLLVTLHRTRPRSIFKVMVTFFLPTIPGYTALYGLTPPDLAVLAPRFVAGGSALGFWNGLFVHLVLFVTAVQCFYHVNRSITLRLLIEFENAADHFLTLAELNKVYGLEEMIRNRLDAMRENGFLVESNDRYYLGPKGRTFALMSRVTRALLRLQEA